VSGAAAATRSAVVVAGPGVVPDGVDAVRRFAAATGVGVLNTYGAKGLFRWDDPAHLGTIGLQAHDVELAGVGAAEVVLAVGLDDRELGASALGSAVVEVDAGDLAVWTGRVHAMPPGRLYGELRGALLPLYDSDEVPLTPAAAAADLGAVLPAGGLVCAVPGVAGLWIARTLPTTELGSVHVPPVDDPALAARAALEAAGERRPTVLVATGPPPPAVDEALTTARADRLPLVVEVWHDGEPEPAMSASGPQAGPAGGGGSDAMPVGGEAVTRAGRRDRLTACLAGGGPHRLDTPVALGLTSVLEAVAGPVTAW
jgi:hypothetical protein